MFKVVSKLATVLVAVSSFSASAGLVYLEDFEGQTNTWNNYSSNIDNVASGTSGIVASSGNQFGLVTPELDLFTGAFTRFGGYNTDFGNGYSTSLDIYLDPTWAIGSGFDYSSAVNGQDGNHQRDFIFNVGMTENNGLVVNATNNSSFDVNDFVLLTANAGDYFSVTDAGWYTFEHVFYDNAGQLAVDFNISLNDAEVWSVTRSSQQDVIASEVGGNRYGWLTFSSVAELAVDNSSLSRVDVPEPSSIAILALGIAGLAASRRKVK